MPPHPVEDVRHRGASHGPLTARDPIPAQARVHWGRWLSAAFGLAVMALLVWAARKIDWQEVLDALKQVPATALVAAGLLCVLSHLIYSSYDLVGRAWTGHTLPVRRVMLITFISYAFNLNLGSLVGGIAMRLRLYAREGLKHPVPTQVLALSLTTNWLGYGLLAGLLFLMGWLAPPPEWPVSASALRGLGALMLGVVATYLALCAFSPRRELRLRGHAMVLPGLRLALMQLLVSSANWLTMGVILYVLLQQGVPYGTTLAVLLVAAVAGVIAHVPAGLGVLEGVFVALLGPSLGHGQVLAALIAYRALYYLLPLALATVAYFMLEARSRR
ncbi:lysylphosphatidylglycerol synthase domain-containing protein [Roseateles amylovorans]|uniref:Lysylphosphatidylglycerol synthase domain-containing protein n=1 Tax=Roseateles amylovorans TaxID=2978473 RepID=A0ABY6AZL4_9BURK|nr:lysylphosphatidylglycerol synthase domain-containing protein [Roseateles amylovorans]UXH76520.1 lysylphosphatidylglycerol synthase domain-containing protein [Roseateles amylovorans]